MFAEERRQRILDILNLQKRVDVADLAERLSASPETIRRDLNEMAADGVLKRTHGGAIASDNRTFRPSMPLLTREPINHEQKMRIARRAAAFIEDGDMIALDNSTTVLCLLAFIPRRYKITILTNSLPIVAEYMAMDDCAWTLVSLGGTVRRENRSTYGLLTCTALGFFQPRKLFMSCAGIDRSGLLTEANLGEAEIKRALMQCSWKTYVLADASKWGQFGSVNEGNVADVDCVVTNAEVDRKRLEFLRGADVEILFDDNP